MLKGMIILLGTLITLGGTMVHVTNTSTPQEEQPMICKAKPNGLQDCEVVSQEQYEKYQEEKKEEKIKSSKERASHTWCEHGKGLTSAGLMEVDGGYKVYIYEDGCVHTEKLYR